VERARHPVVGLVAVLVLALPVTAVAQTLDDLDRAEERVESLEAELDAATAAYETTWARIEETKRELEALQRRALQLERQAREAERLIGDRARAVFKRGSTATLHTLLASEGSDAAVERASMVAALQLRERARVEEAVALRTALEQTRQLVAQREADLDELQAQLEAEAEVLQERLSEAQATAQRIRSVVARQRRIDRGSQRGIYACIFDPGTFRFRDTWGHPRSGGRRHRGTDVFAPMNQPVFAFTSGVVLRTSWSGLGGLGLYLRGDDGNVYYYAHLNSVEPNGRPGTRVTAGQLIARNGATGNASRSAPHVHFEVHPGGGGAINPYPWLAAACF
jgi:peptidoglycan LD-endopeptidase LytH